MGLYQSQQQDLADADNRSSKQYIEIILTKHTKDNSGAKK